MVLGESLFHPAEQTSEGLTDPAVRDTLFDRLVRATSMIFFYDRMLASPVRDEPWHDWGFRHAWNLNLSLPTQAVRDAGCFRVLPHPYGYEDIELAWRLRESRAMPVLWRRAARADHDHRMTPQDYLRREERLGEAALGFARAAPACAAEVFGRDIAEPAEAARCAEFIELIAEEADAGEHALAYAASRAGAEASVDEVEALYRLHLPAKRRAFRRGLLRAIEETGGTGGAGARVHQLPLGADAPATT
jgi:hypothetical protein